MATLARSSGCASFVALRFLPTFEFSSREDGEAKGDGVLGNNALETGMQNVGYWAGPPVTCHPMDRGNWVACE